MSWTDYASAPARGTPICAESDIEGAHALLVTTEKGSFPLLLLRAGETIRAYVNACPHQYLPLNYRGDQLVSADGMKLMCTAHGAQFDIHTGEALQGADCGLDAVPIEVRDGQIHIAVTG
ncbi:Rieske (2Fe-2S) protein [Paracoccus methylarcula]|uniref:(2Fe-2S)-binding protein n=1 Tax=Paracoccus methylarcula TaxID=72022 RepID=A0A422QUH8_9RHOB|nr:Rieske 2Fe-2S domain-containing protein [Paracoccus methylarcula]RNF33462.1 (2Fe-2S)-binding protein [Paracoccus methylarcula]